MKMKKVMAAAMTAVMAFALAACGGSSSASSASGESGAAETTAAGGETQAATTGEGVDKSEIKVGFIFLHDENSTYDKNFMDAADQAAEDLGLSEDQIIKKTNVPEGQECYDAAAELVDSGCNIVFADSFGHEDYMLQAAQEFPEVQFCHATGTQAHTAGLSNFHDAFASIYEGRYLAGVAAGMKLNAMIEDGEFTEDEAKIGYVGAYTYAEVISGYTSFFLGARSVCPSATMEVTFTGSWYDETAEKEAANKLISDGCKLISQHADSMGAPTACESAGVPDVSYNGSTMDACPNTYIISSRIDWTPYYEYAIQCVIDGTQMDPDWTGTLATGSVKLTDLNTDVAAEGTQEKLDEVQKQLEDGTLHVFDTSTFTVTVDDQTNVGCEVDSDGHPTSYMADVDTDENYEGDTEAISDGYFHESEYRSAPYFNLQIDGITLLDTNFGS